VSVPFAAICGPAVAPVAVTVDPPMNTAEAPLFCTTTPPFSGAEPIDAINVAVVPTLTTPWTYPAITSSP
jgi:hypothetical protein